MKSFPLSLAFRMRFHCNSEMAYSRHRAVFNCVLTVTSCFLWFSSNTLCDWLAISMSLSHKQKQNNRYFFPCLMLITYGSWLIQVLIASWCCLAGCIMIGQCTCNYFGFTLTMLKLKPLYQIYQYSNFTVQIH